MPRSKWAAATIILYCPPPTLSPIGSPILHASATPTRMFSPYMRDDCIFAIDDYHAPDAEDKATKVKPWIDEQVAAGRLRDGVLLGGTWFGRLNGAAARQYMRNLLAFTRDAGSAYMAYIEADCAFDGRAVTLALASLRRRARTWPRARGARRHSHARRRPVFALARRTAGHELPLFSASDNTDPCVNGRHYEADMGAGRVALNML